jgi:hypothetical protein
LRRVRVALEEQNVLHIRIGIQHAIAHARYCHLLPARLYNIFQHYLVNGSISEKRVTEHKVYIPIYLQRLSENFLFLRELSEIDEMRLFVFV